jgi:PRC-barrel domain
MMRRDTFTALLVLFGILAASAAYAQSTSTPAPGASSAVPDAVLLRSKALFEYRVKSPQGEDLGKIEAVMIDMEAGRVAYAVLSFAGVFGAGQQMGPGALGCGGAAA